MPQAEAGPEEPPVTERLDSWKEIAAHFKRDVRTVRRWENEGLPVHRHVHKKSATVYAYPHEIDRWWNNRRPVLEMQAKRGQRRRLGLLAGVALVLLVVLLGGFGWRYRRNHGVGAQTALPLRGRLFARATSEGGAVHWIRVGGEPFAVFLHPRGHELYVAGNNEVSVVSTATETVLHRFPLPGLRCAALSRDGRRLYAGTKTGELHIIDTETRKLVSLAAGSHIGGLALAPDNQTLYLATGYSGVKRMRTADNSLSSITSLACPLSLALSPDGRYLYVNYQCGGPGGSWGHDAIDVMDTTTGKSVGTITGLANVGGFLSVSPDGEEIWANGGDACEKSYYDHAGCPIVPGLVMNVIRTSDHKLVRALGFPLASELAWAWFLPDRRRTLLGGHHLKVVDTTTLTTVEELPFQSTGAHALTADHGRMYVPSDEKGDVAVLDVAGDKCMPAPSGLANWWSGDGTANDVRDGNHGEMKGGMGFAPGLAGQAFRFDGVDDTVSLPASGNCEMELSFTWTGWIKPGAGAGPMAIAEASPTAADRGWSGWELFRDERQQIAFCLTRRGGPRKTSDCIRSQTAVTAGAWHQVTVVKTPETMLLYVDGTLEGKGPGEQFHNRRRLDLRLGSSADGRAFYHGLMDELQCYKRALDPAEIQRLFAAGKNGVCY